MTTRGRTAASLRPTTPPDPTLNTRPVPRTRNFTPRSFGPGAVPNIRDLIRPVEAVREESDPATYLDSMHAEYYANSLLEDEILRLIQEVQHLDEVIYNGIVTCNPTWGFYVFATDYSPDVLEKLPQAMNHLIEATRRNVRQLSTSAYADEAYRRFKLDVVLDEENLSGASDDRVREEFRAQLRTLQMLDEEDYIQLPARNYACLVLDRPTVFMLADLSFPEDMEQDYLLFHSTTIKVVDAWWKRPATNISPYRGVGHCPITGLAWFYLSLCTSANSGAMEDIWPLEKEY
ncbi:hypothetical protein PHISCL_07711 [Aspergillus sclerotialis]|uniref:Uncharacterized protein n=1 Tax=Aspergillus sclerotialis TaxID=2070753 RepID=A0A3A2ZF41_9EURO|nr:hypothetical protein PHISCL_07711 [Aspergillus sclerotialis]